jgi:hypothetical protein
VGYTYSDFSELRIPDEFAADDVAAHLSYLVEQVDPKLMGDASSTADRDSKFYDAPAGFMARVTDAGNDDALVGVYIKTVPAGEVGWYALYEPLSALVEQPLLLLDGIEQRNVDQPPTYTRENLNFGVLSGAVVKSDASTIVNATSFAYLPSTVTPFHGTRDYPVATNYNGTNTGSSKIHIASWDRSITYWGPPTTWVGLSGVRFRIVP